MTSLLGAPNAFAVAQKVELLRAAEAADLEFLLEVFATLWTEGSSFRPETTRSEIIDHICLKLSILYAWRKDAVQPPTEAPSSESHRRKSFKSLSSRRIDKKEETRTSIMINPSPAEKDALKSSGRKLFDGFSFGRDKVAEGFSKSREKVAETIVIGKEKMAEGIAKSRELVSTGIAKGKEHVTDGFSKGLSTAKTVANSVYVTGLNVLATGTFSIENSFEGSEGSSASHEPEVIQECRLKMIHELELQCGIDFSRICGLLDCGYQADTHQAKFSEDEEDDEVLASQPLTKSFSMLLETKRETRFEMKDLECFSATLARLQIAVKQCIRILKLPDDFVRSFLRFQVSQLSRRQRELLLSRCFSNLKVFRKFPKGLDAMCWLNIVSFLPIQDWLTSIRVLNHHFLFLTGITDLWDTLSSFKFFRSWIPFSKDDHVPLFSRLRGVSALFGLYPSGTADFLPLISMFCRGLEELDLSGTGLYDSNLLIPVLTNCKYLISLDLSGCTAVDDNLLRVISESVLEIQKLNISGCVFSSIGLKHLEVCTCLTDLDISIVSNSLDLLSEDSFSSISRLTRLSYLNMSYRKCKSAVLGEILNNCSDLRSLFIRGLETTHGVSWSGALASLPYLEVLDISECASINTLSLIDIASFCPNLTTLYASGCGNIEDMGLVRLFDGCTKLTSVDLSNCQELTEHIFEAMPFSFRDLESVSVGRVRDDFFKILGENLCNLKSLSCSDCSLLSDSAVSFIFSYFHELESLQLYEAQSLTGIGFQSACSSGSGLCLKHFALRDAKLFAGVSVITLAQSFPVLSKLELINCPLVTQSDLLVLFASPCRLKLQLLNLSQCLCVNDDLLSIISLCIPNLASLDVSGSVLSDAGVEHLSTNCKRLKYLYISETQVSGNVFQVLCSLMSDLIVLDIRKCPNVPSSNIGTCQRQNPHLKMIR